MQVDQFVVTLNSQQPERLIAFYRDAVGLTPNPDVEPGAFMAGSSTFVALIIEGHDVLEGATKEPERVMLNFIIDDVAGAQRRLEAEGVRFTRSASAEPPFAAIATFVDPDGNYCQLMQFQQ